MGKPDHPPAGPALLIALTGTPGQGRTRLLAELAAEFRAANKRVEGILAVAGTRSSAQEGADCYRLHILGKAKDLPWTERVPGESGSTATPCTFDAQTHRRLRTWADGLRTQSPGAPLDAR